MGHNLNSNGSNSQASIAHGCVIESLDVYVGPQGLDRRSGWALRVLMRPAAPLAPVKTGFSRQRFCSVVRTAGRQPFTRV